MNLELNQLIRPRPGETTVFFLRRHPIIFLGELVYVALLAAVPVGIGLMLVRLWPNLLAGPMTRPAIILLASAYYLVVWLFFIGYFVDYYLDAWVLTTERIINVEQNGLFSRTISELDLSRTQDVTSEVKGILPSVFGFGYVYVQTAGERERFVFEQVPHPHEVRKRILELVEADQIRLEKEGVRTLKMNE
jgi:uncharacterized membrane protein YdbT with pleckstrin-like domain